MKKIFTMMMLTAIVTICSAQIPTNGLVAWYPFNGNAVDSSGNGYDGTVIGSPVLVTGHDGLPFSAYEFNGDTSDAVALPAIALQGNAPFSVFCWIKTPEHAYSNVEPFLVFGNASPDLFYGYDQIALVLGAYDPWTTGVTLKCGGNAQNVYSNPLQPNTWHYVGLTYDSTHTFRLYIDTAFTPNYQQQDIHIIGQDNYIGHNNYLVPQYGMNHSTFHGAVDNVMYFGRVLDSTEIVSCRDFPSIITSVNDIAKEKLSIEVYPNPSDGNFQIMSPAKSGTFQLYNTLGNIVNQGKLEGKVTLSEIPQGFYLLKVYTDGVVQEKKVVVCK